MSHDSRRSRSAGVPVLMLGWIDVAGNRIPYPRDYRRRFGEVIRTTPRPPRPRSSETPFALGHDPIEPNYDPRTCPLCLRGGYQWKTDRQRHTRNDSQYHAAGHDPRTCPLCLGGGHPSIVGENQEERERKMNLVRDQRTVCTELQE